MEQKKICPTCNTENGISELLCGRCYSDISAVNPSNKNPDTPIKKPTQEPKISSDKSNTSPDPDVTIRQKKTFIKLTFPDKKQVVASDKDFIGRNGIGSLNFNNLRTVSRKHAQFIFENEKWFIIDCNSSNGTFINGQQIEPSKPYEIKNRDKLSLSTQLTFEVQL